MSSATLLRSKHGILFSVLAVGFIILGASKSPVILAEENSDPPSQKQTEGKQPAKPEQNKSGENKSGENKSGENKPGKKSGEKQAEKKQPEGLQGILPENVPFGLLEDDFLRLGDSWETWSRETAAEVAKLYDPQDLDVAAQRDLLKKLDKRLATMEKALSDSAYDPISNELAAQHSRLSRRVKLARSVLDTLQMDPAEVHQKKVAAAAEDVTASINRLEEYLSRIRKGEAWLEYIRTEKLRQAVQNSTSPELVNAVHAKLSNPGEMENDAQREFLQRPPFRRLVKNLDRYIDLTSGPAPEMDQSRLRDALASLVDSLEQYEESPTTSAADAAREAYQKVRWLAPDDGDLIADTLATQYFNYNLRVVADEAFLNKIVGYSHKDSGVVDDFILGAKVDGYQWTTGMVAVDLRPNDHVIEFDMSFDGTTQTSTQGVTEQATIFTSGYHTFLVEKAIRFDGDRFETSPARIRVNPNNTTTGAQTTISKLPLVGHIADNYAVSEARKRKPQSEAIAAAKLRRRVLPEFNAEVDAEFNDLSSEVQDRVNPRLRDGGLFPDARSYRSTEDSMRIGTRLMAGNELGGDTPAFESHIADSLAIHLHETLLNNSVDNLVIAGNSYTEKELGREIEASLRVVLGQDFTLPEGEEESEGSGDEADRTRFVFAEQDAIKLEAQEGELVLTLRMGLEPEDGDSIPTQKITVPLNFSIDGDNIVIAADQDRVSVAPVEPVSQFVQIPRAGIVKAKIQEALPTRKVDRIITLERDEGGPVDLEIAEIRPNAGWLTIVIK